MIVYLLHYDSPTGQAGHYLGTADDESAIDLSKVRHGHGWRSPPARGVTIADVWEVEDVAAADALRRRLSAQGGRARLCSVCSPGNGRGLGRGKYERRKASQPAAAQEETTR